MGPYIILYCFYMIYTLFLHCCYVISMVSYVTILTFLTYFEKSFYTYVITFLENSGSSSACLAGTIGHAADSPLYAMLRSLASSAGTDGHVRTSCANFVVTILLRRAVRAMSCYRASSIRRYNNSLGTILRQRALPAM